MLLQSIEIYFATGVPLATIKDGDFHTVIGPKESVTIAIDVDAEEYEDKLDDEGLISIFLRGSIKVIM